jgi:hypothetical protein
VRATFPQIDPQQIALDGKEVHHSMDAANDWSNLRMISAWAVENGIVLGQVAVDDTSNEITALPAVLALVDVRDCDITADALHCQTATIDAIRTADAHYTIGVKSNQKTLYHDIMATFATLRADDQPSILVHETIEKGMDVSKRAVTGSLMTCHTSQRATLGMISKALAWWNQNARLAQKQVISGAFYQ